MNILIFIKPYFYFIYYYSISVHHLLSSLVVMVTCPRIQPMACKSLASHRFRNSLPISSISNASMFSRATYPTASTVHRSKTFACRSVSVASSNFTWEDAVHISLPESFQDDPSDLTGYFEKVKLCNRGSVGLKAI